MPFFPMQTGLVLSFLSLVLKLVSVSIITYKNDWHAAPQVDKIIATTTTMY